MILYYAVGVIRKLLSSGLFGSKVHVAVIVRLKLP